MGLLRSHSVISVTSDVKYVLTEIGKILFNEVAADVVIENDAHTPLLHLHK